MKKMTLYWSMKKKQNKTKCPPNSKRENKNKNCNKKKKETISCSSAVTLEIKDLIREKTIYWKLRKKEVFLVE